MSSPNQQISPNEISATFLNASVEQANAFQAMRNVALQVIEDNKLLKNEIITLQKTNESQQEELVKFKQKGVVKTD